MALRCPGPENNKIVVLGGVESGVQTRVCVRHVVYLRTCMPVGSQAVTASSCSRVVTIIESNDLAWLSVLSLSLVNQLMYRSLHVF